MDEVAEEAQKSPGLLGKVLKRGKTKKTMPPPPPEAAAASDDALSVSCVRSEKIKVEGKGNKAFAVYVVKVGLGRLLPWEVQHRFSEFVALRKHLASLYDEVGALPFPTKLELSSLAKSTRTKRVRELDAWCSAVLLALTPARAALSLTLAEFLDLQTHAPRAEKHHVRARAKTEAFVGSAEAEVAADEPDYWVFRDGQVVHALRADVTYLVETKSDTAEDAAADEEQRRSKVGQLPIKDYFTRKPVLPPSAKVPPPGWLLFRLTLFLVDEDVALGSRKHPRVSRRLRH
jgi:hypothetical protein